MIFDIQEKISVYKCNKQIMEYLVYTCHLPILGFDKDYYYFAETPELKAFVGKMPLRLKIIALLTK